MPRPGDGCFRPGATATLATICALAALLALGFWQLQRMAWKRELITQIEHRLAAPPLALAGTPAQPTGLDWRRVRIEAQLLADYSFAWGMEAIGGEAGARLVTPARLADGRLVLVDRGFVVERELPPQGSAAMSVEGPVVIEGVARALDSLAPGWFTPRDEPGRLRFWRLDRAALRALLGEEPPAILIIAERSEPPTVLRRVQPVRPAIRNPHLGYALTWFGLAAALLAIYVVFGLSHRRNVGGILT